MPNEISTVNCPECRNDNTVESVAVFGQRAIACRYCAANLVLDFVHTDRTKEYCPEARGHFCLRWGEHGHGGYNSITNRYYQGGQPFDKYLDCIDELIDCYEAFKAAKANGLSEEKRACAAEINEIRNRYSFSLQKERELRREAEEEVEWIREPRHEREQAQRLRDDEAALEQRRANLQSLNKSIEAKNKQEIELVYQEVMMSPRNKAIGLVTLVFGMIGFVRGLDERLDFWMMILFSYLLPLCLLFHQYGIRKGPARLFRLLMSYGIPALVVMPLMISMSFPVWLGACGGFALTITRPLSLYLNGGLLESLVSGISALVAIFVLGPGALFPFALGVTDD